MLRRCGKECYVYNVKVFSYILYCNKTSFVEVALPVPYGGGLQPVHPLLRGRLPLDQLPHLICMLTDGQKKLFYTLDTKGFLTFSCNIFKWFLISETSSSLEAEENSDDVDDDDAVRDFA